MGKRLSAEETVDPVIHFLSRLQSEGWGVAQMTHEVIYGTPGKSGLKLPIEATVTVRLVPAKE